MADASTVDRKVYALAPSVALSSRASQHVAVVRSASKRVARRFEEIAVGGAWLIEVGDVGNPGGGGRYDEALGVGWLVIDRRPAFFR